MQHREVQATIQHYNDTYGKPMQRNKKAVLTKELQRIKAEAGAEQAQGQSTSKSHSSSKQRQIELLEKEQYLWRGSPGELKLNAQGKSYVQYNNYTQKTHQNTHSAGAVGGYKRREDRC